MPKDDKKQEERELKELALEKVKVGFDEIEKIIKETKEKYEGADDETKKKVKQGLAGAAIALGSIIGASALKKHLKKDKD